MSAVHADPEAAWSARLVHYPDVPRRHVDLAENAVRSVLDDTMTMWRELQGPPGWSVRKYGRAGRVFITVEEALNFGTAILDLRIRGELAAAPDEGDPDKLWARRIAEYAGLPLRAVDAAEEALEDVARRKRWSISRTDRGTPGWLFEIPMVGWEIFVSAVDLGSRDIEHLVAELDRIVIEPINEDPDVEKELPGTVNLSREALTSALREAAARGMDHTSGPSSGYAASCRDVADGILKAIDAARFVPGDYVGYVEDEQRAAR